MAAGATAASTSAKLKSNRVQVQYASSDSDSESDDGVGNVSDTSDSSGEAGVKQKQSVRPKSGDAEGSSSTGDDSSDDQLSGDSEEPDNDDGGDADIDSVSSVTSDKDDDTTEGNTGWADAMSKILGRGTGDKQVILAKGQTDKEILKRKAQKVAEEAGEKYVDEDERRREFQAKRAKRLEWENMGRVKPDPLQKDRERVLQRIATRGVVQLFNAVKKQQKVVSETLEGTKTESQKDKALRTLKKGEFLDMLKSEGSGDTEEQQRAKKQPWLSDDYMTKATLKDWTGHDSDGADDERE